MNTADTKTANKVIDLRALQEKQPVIETPVWLSFSKTGKANIDHVLLADEIHKEINFFKNDVQFKYFCPDDGIWKENAKEFLVSYIINKLGPYSKQQIVQETLFQLTGKFHKSNKYNPFENSNPYIVAVKNGTLNLETGEFQESFNPKHYIQTKHSSLKYDPAAKCPKIEETLAGLVGEEQLPFLWEWFGFQLVRKYKPNAFLFLVGQGGSGKSAVIDLLKAFVGIENMEAYSLETLTDSGKTYPIADLYGKSANICGDIDAKYMSNPGVLKHLTGDDVVNGDRKFQKSLKFKNYAKLTFSMNSLPALSDYTNGMKRRALILKIDRIIPQEEINFNIVEEITAEEELSGLLNKAIEGVQRLIENKWFTITPFIQNEIDKWFEDSDLVSQFLQEKCEVRETEEGSKKDPSYFIHADTLFERFDIWLDKANNKPMTKQTFFKRLANLGYPKSKKKLTKDERRMECYKHLPDSFQAVYDVKLANRKNNYHNGMGYLD